MAFRSRRLLSSTASFTCGLVLLIGCGDGSEAMIGPEGGELKSGAITVVIPPGAMGSTRTLKITEIDDNLGRAPYTQVSDSWLLEPTDLRLKIPATVTVSKLKDVKEPTLLHVPRDTQTTHTYTMGSGDEAIGYLGEFGKVAAGEGATPQFTVAAPPLAMTPDEANAAAPLTDSAPIAFSGAGSADVILTAYDLSGENNRDLNGGAYCAFKPEMVNGASIATGCSTGVASVTLNLTGANVDFNAVPFLLDKVDGNVVVQVEVGSQGLVHTFGYFSFSTSPCYYETCDGYGACVDNGGAASCDCIDGYAPPEDDALSCVCVPQCDGRECGSDSCGGQCSPGCGDGFDCNGDAGVCEPDGSTTTDPTTTSTTSTTGTTTGTSGDTTTTTSGGTTTGTTGTTGMDMTTGTTGTTTGTTGG
jgi:hypothetical protein